MFTPKRGSICWVDFDTVGARGHEQKGRRPAIVTSEDAYNHKTGRCFIFPVTTKGKNPLAVEIPDGSCSISGFILSDQGRTIDWKARWDESEFTDEVILDETLDLAIATHVAILGY